MDAGTERMLRIFQAFDLDGDGSITREELELLLSALDGGKWGDGEIDEFIQLADMNGDGMIQFEEFVKWLYGSADSEELEAAGESLAVQCPPGMDPCRYGKACYNRKPGHRKKYWHPADPAKRDCRREACRYGSGCYRRSTAHLERYAHPGDRNYRKGLVKFGSHRPQFETLLQLFDFHDPEESGYLQKEEFAQTFEYCSKDNSGAEQIDSEWEAAGGTATGYVNFSRFASWAAQHCSLPIGLSEAGQSRPCQFRNRDGDDSSCSCAEFSAVGSGRLCECGHKESCHRSIADVFSIGEDALKHWQTADDGSLLDGLVNVENDDVIGRMQELFNQTHKTSDNWTRDRGCALHGRSHPECDAGCLRKNGHRVPKGFVVKKVFRNQNLDLWKHYVLMRNAISSECGEDSSFSSVSVHADVTVEAGMSDTSNEWRLFHGTNIDASRGICGSNFRLALSGTGATWKEPGEAKGSPLYGFGIYLAEMVTKSDEYADPLPEGEEEEGLHAMLVVRCVGGRANVIETNEIDKEQLKKEVFDGPYHSVFGDRVKTLGKPYREIIVYDKDQIYPEYLVLYERLLKK